MSNVEKISVALPRELNALLQNAVKSGRYASASEVVREALRDWKSRQDFKAEALKDLKRMIRDGEDSGPSRFSSIEDIIAEGRRQLALEQNKAS